MPRSATTRVSTSPKRARLAVVESRRRLVEQQHVERAGQASGELDQAALAGGEVADLHVRQRLDATQRERSVGRGVDHGGLAGAGDDLAERARPAMLASRPIATLCPTVRVSTSSMRWKVRPTRPAARRRAPARHVVAVESHPPGTRRLRPLHTSNVVVLPGAVRADQTGDSGGRGGEGKAVDRDDAAEAHAESVDLESGAARRPAHERDGCRHHHGCADGSRCGHRGWERGTPRHAGPTGRSTP